MLKGLNPLINVEGVKAYLTKIQSLLEWSLPLNTQALRRFLNLTGYYQNFIHNYGLITAPLIDLLKKNAFEWSEKAFMAFKELKKTVT